MTKQLVLAWLLLGGVGHSQQCERCFTTSIETGARWTVTGTVVDSVDHRPLAGVTVAGRNGEVGFSTRSDQSGKFSLSGDVEGIFTFWVPRHSTVYPSGNFRSVHLTKGQRLDGVTLTLTPEGSISGRVEDAAGQPIRGALMIPYRLMWRYGRLDYEWTVARQTVQTDAEGRFTVKDLSPGQYILAASPFAAPFQIVGPIERQGAGKPSHLPSTTREADAWTFYPNADSPEAAGRVQVSAGARVEGIRIRMRRVPSVCVRVLADPGKPLPAGAYWGIYVNFPLGFSPYSIPIAYNHKVALGQTVEACGLPSDANLQLEAIQRYEEGVADKMDDPLLDNTVLIKQRFSTHRKDLDLGRMIAVGRRPLPVRIRTDGKVGDLSGAKFTLSDPKRGMMWKETWQLDLKVPGDRELPVVLPGSFHWKVTGLPGNAYVSHADQDQRDVLDKQVQPGLPVTVRLASDGARLTVAVTGKQNQLPVSGSLVIAGAKREARCYAVPDTGPSVGIVQVPEALAPGEYRVAFLPDMPSARCEFQPEGPEAPRWQSVKLGAGESAMVGLKVTSTVTSTVTSMGGQ